MKTPRPDSREHQVQAEADLYRAIRSLSSEDECRRFFRDLLTPTELRALADRWAVVPLLAEGLPYRRIYELTGVSVTTVGRVARYLGDGHGGYALALTRLSAAAAESGRTETTSAQKTRPKQIVPK